MKYISYTNYFAPVRMPSSTEANTFNVRIPVRSSFFAAICTQASHNSTKCGSFALVTSFGPIEMLHILLHSFLEENAEVFRQNFTKIRYIICMRERF